VTTDAYDQALSAWGFPRFARDFPRDPELDRLVVAFTKGDYASVRAGAPKLVEAAEDVAVKDAARRLLGATRPDPAVKLLLLLTGALLAFLSAWWVAHDGPPPSRANAPAPPPTVEFPK
jgi:hypothetical protein